MKKKLCLGTAQFGMNYGITNSFGKLKENEINRILKLASSAGIKMIDTASDYGDAEILLGNNLHKEDNFEIFSKININKNITQENIVDELNKKFENSLRNLKLKRIDGLFLHDCSLLNTSLREGIINWFKSIKLNRSVKAIGVSIYDPSDLDLIPLNEFNLIQVPLSLYDQRFLENGTLTYLISKGISIHIRSIFMQGLILQPVRHWPNFLSEEFKIHHQKIFSQLDEQPINMLRTTLDFITSLPQIDAALIGVSRINDLVEIINLWNDDYISENVGCEKYSKFAWLFQNDIDPRLWPKK